MARVVKRVFPERETARVEGFVVVRPAGFRAWAVDRLLDVKAWLGIRAHRLNGRLGVRCALCGMVMAPLPDRDVYRCASPVCNHEASATEYWHRGPITTLLGGL